jgi:hypothetical protein
VAERLATAAGAALSAEAGSERWLTVLDAVAYSPVRRAVVPAGTPAEPDEPLLALVRKHAGRVPAVAERFGVAVPAAPAKGGRERARRARPGGPPPPRAPVAPAGTGLRRIPPPPVRPIPAPAPAEAKPHGDELAHLVGTGHTDPPPAATGAPHAEPAPDPAEAKPHGDELAHLVDPESSPGPAPEQPPAPPAAVERAEATDPEPVELQHAEPAAPPGEAKPHGDELAHLTGAPAAAGPGPEGPTPAPAEAKPHGDELEHLASPGTDDPTDD